MVVETMYHWSVFADFRHRKRACGKKGIGKL